MSGGSGGIPPPVPEPEEVPCVTVVKGCAAFLALLFLALGVYYCAAVYDPGDPAPASYRECEKWEREFLTGGPNARAAKQAYDSEDCWNRRWGE